MARNKAQTRDRPLRDAGSLPGPLALSRANPRYFTLGDERK
jgi:hypothetical protein